MAAETVNFSVSFLVSPSVLVFIPATLSLGTVNVAYPSTPIGTVTGGTPPYTFSVDTTTVPAGMTVDSSGNLSGTPTSAGSYTLTGSISDSTP